jgi:hypothetical protein
MYKNTYTVRPIPNVLGSCGFEQKIYKNYNGILTLKFNIRRGKTLNLGILNGVLDFVIVVYQICVSTCQN